MSVGYGLSRDGANVGVFVGLDCRSTDRHLVCHILLPLRLQQACCHIRLPFTSFMNGDVPLDPPST
eukprot:1317206-Amorphochlora_amoeboformis.AAC.2